MIYAAYYDLTTKLVNIQLSRETVGDLPPGTYVLIDEIVPGECYIDASGDIQPLPEKPSEDYVWNPLTYSWVTDLYAAGEARGDLAILEADFYWKRGFWTEVGGMWREVVCSERNLGRIRDAAILASLTAPGDPFSAIVEIDEYPTEVTRAEAILLHSQLMAHSAAVDNEVLRMMNEALAVYVLADTDLAAGLAAMLAITWTYIPVAP